MGIRAQRSSGISSGLRVAGSLMSIALRLPKSKEGFLAYTFLLVITVGTILLSLSPSGQSGDVGLIDALFTATSATCVTGLSVVDTEQSFSYFGKIIILSLIQIGGLGLMTFTCFAFAAVGAKISLSSQSLISEVFYQREKSVTISLFWIITLTFFIELLGALLLLADMPPSLGDDERFFAAVFHSISAFCNAGFSTFSDGLSRVADRPIFLFAISLLTIAGGIGYSVMIELLEFVLAKLVGKRVACLSLHTKVVLVTSSLLSVLGVAGLFLFGIGAGHAGASLSLADSALYSVFSRTSGFGTVDLGVVSLPIVLLLIFLMFIGGSPGSCAGGVKTTTLATCFAALRSELKGQRDVVLFARRIPHMALERASNLIVLAVSFNAFGLLVLSITESSSGAGLTELLFEQVSSFATVGLSMGITSSLSSAGKLWIVLSMFVGRIGPMAFALLVWRERADLIRYPEEHCMIG